MLNADRILAALADAPGPLCDDCLSARAEITPRQQVNQLATRMAARGTLVRARSGCAVCHREKLASTTSSTIIDNNEKEPKPARTTPLVDHDHPWHWEGNVQGMLRRHLEQNGWTITAAANTATMEPGVDLAARRDGRELFVEVKGFPTKTYERGAKRGEPKPTPPANQAHQWYAHALRTIMQLRHRHAESEVALCFPDFPTYRKLIDSTRTSLEAIRVGAFLISETGVVTSALQTAPTPRKYQLPAFLTGTLSQEAYQRWLSRKATTHVRRDRGRGNSAATRESYMLAIHEAVVRSTGADAYTGEPLRWDLVSTYDNDLSRLDRRAYRRTLALLPTIDHIGDGTGPADFAICSWRVNDAKNDLSYNDFLELCRAVIANAQPRRPEHTPNEQLAPVSRKG